MLSEATLKNMYKHEIKTFLKGKKIPNLDEKLKTSVVSNYAPYVDVINENIRSGVITEEDINNLIEDKIFYYNNNYHYIFELQSLFIDKDEDIDINEFISRNPQLLFNHTLSTHQLNADFELCKSSFELNTVGELKKIHFLLKVDKINTYRGEINLFSAVTIDVTNRLLIIRFNLNYLEQSNHEKVWLVDYIKKQLVNRKQFQPLKLSFIQMNEVSANKSIYNLFNTLSTEIEGIMDKQIESDTEALIGKFLESANVADSDEDYSKQLKSILYQDISKKSSSKLFESGWAFRFVFKEGNHTRASSRTEKYNPIYSSKIYWSLKELIIESGQIIEAGFHWYKETTTIENKKVKKIKIPIIVKLESKNNAIIVTYYQKNTDYKSLSRKEKEDFVLQKIRSHFCRK